MYVMLCTWCFTDAVLRCYAVFCVLVLLILQLLYCTLRFIAVFRVAVMYLTFCCCCGLLQCTLCCVRDVLRMLYCTLRSMAVDIRVVVLYVTFCCRFRAAVLYLRFCLCADQRRAAVVLWDHVWESVSGFRGHCIRESVTSTERRQYSVSSVGYDTRHG